MHPMRTFQHPEPEDLTLERLLYALSDLCAWASCAAWQV